MSGDPPIRAWLWRNVGRLLFRWTPYGAFGARRRLLKAFGARLGRTTKVRKSVTIDRPWNLAAGERTAFGDGAAVRARAPVRVGDRCTVSQLAILSTEAIDPAARESPIVGAIAVEDDGWVAADALVLPGVTVHAGAVVGARSVVEADVPAWTIVAGQPATVRKERRFAAAESEEGSAEGTA